MAGSRLVPANLPKERLAVVAAALGPVSSH
jgi:hypothetical protein